jgi:hypothetical protein
MIFGPNFNDDWEEYQKAQRDIGDIEAWKCLMFWAKSRRDDTEAYYRWLKENYEDTNHLLELNSNIRLIPYGLDLEKNRVLYILSI